jgi:hypothetical protein
MPFQTYSIGSLLEHCGVPANVANTLVVNNSLSYEAMLTILDDAAKGGMTAGKFDALQTLASKLNAGLLNNGITTSAYVQQIADDVIGGNTANAWWNGGSSTAKALGDLTATSTQTQVDELIGKWFLGTDLPSMDVSGIGGKDHDPSYQLINEPLYCGVPKYTDVNQGHLGDCYLMSSLGETALQDPSAIESMISSNGNGTASVRFYIDGRADYVTVNDDLPVMGDGTQWANGSTLDFANGSPLWAPLIEKAYVELNEQTAAASFGKHTQGDAYEDIEGGYATAITEITNQSVTDYHLTGDSATTLNNLMATLGADWSNHDDILLSTPKGKTAGDLVGWHMYEVIGVNVDAGTITLQNPWNTGYSGSLSMSFTETISQLASDHCAVHVSNGSV